MFEKMFGGGAAGKEVSERHEKDMEAEMAKERKEKAIKMIEKDASLKKSYDSLAGKVDDKGRNMQERFEDAVLKYPGRSPLAMDTEGNIRPTTILGGTLER